MACQRRCETAVAAKSRINDKNAVDCNLSLPKKKMVENERKNLPELCEIGNGV